ncbi:hypothetical protein IKA92_01920 [bacterium]|nr:hypothetical protein [bacterium]
MTQKQLTKKEQRKQARLLIVKKLESLENQIKSFINNPETCNFDELLFSVAEIKILAKNQSECIRLAEVVCFCGKNEQKDTYFKHLLYSNINKILEIDNIQQSF